MTQRTRIFLAAVILLVLVGIVLGIDQLQRRSSQPSQAAEGEVTPVAGSVPIHLDGQLVGSFSAADLEQLETVSFVDAEEGKTQEGWLLRDVLLLHVDDNSLKADSLVAVSSSSRDKTAQLTWMEVADPANWVVFDLSNRGTLKLVSVLEKLDTRDEWVQDVDRIDITSD